MKLATARENKIELQIHISGVFVLFFSQISVTNWAVNMQKALPKRQKNRIADFLVQL